LPPPGDQFRAARHEPRQGDGSFGFARIGQAEHHAAIPLARGKIIAQGGRPGVKALRAILQRGLVKPDGTGTGAEPFRSPSTMRLTSGMSD